MTCSQCNDTGVIQTPVRWVSRRLQRSHWDEVKKEFFDVEVSVIDKAGGSDACLSCTRYEEARWKGELAYE